MQTINNNNMTSSSTTTLSTTSIPVPEEFDGTLSLTICDAELKGQERKDPYCKVSLGSSKLTQRLKEGETWGKERYTTQAKAQAGNHPVWNESHDFSIRKMKQDSHLKIKLYDRDVAKDDYLGLAKINLSELVQNLGKGEKQYYPLSNKDNFSIGRIGIITKFVGMDLPVPQQVVKPVHDQGQHIPGGVPDHIQGKDEFQPALASGVATGVATGAAAGIASHHLSGRDQLSSGKDEIKASDFATTHDKVPESAAVRDLSTGDLSTTDRSLDRDHHTATVQPGTIRDETGTSGVHSGTHFSSSSTPASTSSSSGQAGLMEKGKAKLAEAAALAGPTYRQTMPEALGGGYPVQSGTVRDRDGDISHHQQPSIMEKGKEKLAEAAALAGPTYRQTMPEALGGGYPIQSGVVRNEHGEIISHQQPSMMEQGKEKLNQATAVAKETYQETMPEALGGRPATWEEKQAGTGLQKAQLTAQQMVEKGKEKLTEAAILAGPTYRQTMPEALGGGYPVERALIQDENGTRIPGEREPTRIASEHLLTVQPVSQPVPVDETVTERATTTGSTTGSTLIDHAKALYKEVAPEALGGRPPTLVERVAQGYKPGTTEEDTSLIGKAKALAAETLPESLGGRPPTLGEKLKAETTLMGKAQVLKEETLPTALGGRTATWHEQKGTPEPIRSGDSLLGKVKKVYTETAPEALGGRPATLTEKAKDKAESAVESAVERSLLTAAKEAYKGTMPEVLGGRPSVTEHTQEKLEEAQPQPSLLERVKQTVSTLPGAGVITETIPGMLGLKSTPAHEATEIAPERLTEVVRSDRGETLPSNMTGEETKDIQRAHSRVNQDVQVLKTEPVPVIQKIEYTQRIEVPLTDNIESIQVVQPAIADNIQISENRTIVEQL